MDCNAPPGKPVSVSDPSSLGSLVGVLRSMAPDNRNAPTDRSFTEAVMIQECSRRKVRLVTVPWIS